MNTRTKIDLSLLAAILVAFFLLRDAEAATLRSFLRIGSSFIPSLHIWGDINRAADRLLVKDDTGVGAIRGFSIVRQGQQYGWGVAGTARVDAPDAEGVGISGYAEANVKHGHAWAANLFARAYVPNTTVVGAEISAGNMADETVIAYGEHLIVEGLAPTTAGLVVEPSLALPEGRAKTAIWIKANEANNGTAARETGLRIDAVDSGEAIKIQSGQRIALSEDGEVFLQYNKAADTITLTKHGVVVAQW